MPRAAATRAATEERSPQGWLPEEVGEALRGRLTSAAMVPSLWRYFRMTRRASPISGNGKTSERHPKSLNVQPQVRGFGETRRGLVVAVRVFQAAVQGANEPVDQAPERVVVVDAAGAEVVRVGAGAWRWGSARRRLGRERVDDPFVVDVPGSDDLVLAARKSARLLTATRHRALHLHRYL